MEPNPKAVDRRKQDRRIYAPTDLSKQAVLNRAIAWLDSVDGDWRLPEHGGGSFDLIKDLTLVLESLRSPAQDWVSVPAKNYVAWCRYVNTDGSRPTRIVICDSDSPGAFKVYRAAPSAAGRESEEKPMHHEKCPDGRACIQNTTGCLVGSCARERYPSANAGRESEEQGPEATSAAAIGHVLPAPSDPAAIIEACAKVCEDEREKYSDRGGEAQACRAALLFAAERIRVTPLPPLSADVVQVPRREIEWLARQDDGSPPDYVAMEAISMAQRALLKLIGDGK